MKLCIKHSHVFNRLFKFNSKKENLKTAVENMKVVSKKVKIVVKKIESNKIKSKGRTRAGTA